MRTELIPAANVRIGADCPLKFRSDTYRSTHEGATHSGTLIAMATVTRTFLVDDLDGSTEDVENVRLSLDGTDFEIDLSAANAARLREKLAKYVEHGTRVTPQKTRRTSELSSRRCPGGIRSRRCGTGPGRTGTRCRPAGASP